MCDDVLGSKRDHKNLVSITGHTTIELMATRSTPALPRNDRQETPDGPWWHCGRQRGAVEVLWVAWPDYSAASDETLNTHTEIYEG